MNNHIVLIPFGHIESTILLNLANEIKEIFKAQVLFKEKEPIPRIALNPYRNQYRSEIFLRTLKQLNLNTYALGLTEVDLYFNHWEYVFSKSDPPQKVAIVSILRLNPGFYKMLEDLKVYYSRISKVCFYELGKLYQLTQCPNSECVMHPVRTIVDIDLKTENFCGNCKRRLQEVLNL
jgi:archaemetzincin